MRPVWTSRSRPTAWPKSAAVSRSAGSGARPRSPSAPLHFAEHGPKPGVQVGVQLAREAERLHAAEQVEAEIEVAGAVAIVVEEGEGRGQQALDRCGAPVDRSEYGRLQAVERAGEQVAINLLLAGVIEIECTVGVAGLPRNRAQAGAFEALIREDPARGGEDDLAAVVVDGATPLAAAVIFCAPRFQHPPLLYRPLVGATGQAQPVRACRRITIAWHFIQW
jgi:hypothetical protein